MLMRVLLAVCEGDRQEALQKALPRTGMLVESLPQDKLHWKRAAHRFSDLLVISHRLLPEPPEPAVTEFLADPEAPLLLVMDAPPDASRQAHLLATGCRAVLPADLPAQDVARVICTVAGSRGAWLGRAVMHRDVPDQPRLSDFVSRSPSMQAFMEVVRRVTPSSASLMILGETGVGKERLARAIHTDGPRGGAPFVAVNCGALPDGLLESELFGHEEGAFTGATRCRRGCFEMAHGGTLFLDEIGETSPHLQVKLLRALQERNVQRVGGERALEVDVRVIAATNCDLEGEVAAGRFRRDLYYRLGVITLCLPPLRERREDIAELAEAYLEYLRPRIGRDVVGMDRDVKQALERYAWPGNVRELINVIERAMLLSETGRVTRADLPLSIIGACSGDAPPWNREPPTTRRGEAPEFGWPPPPLSDVRQRAVQDAEIDYLSFLLRKTGGRIAETARLAGIGPRNLHARMRQWGLRKEEFKPPRQDTQT